MIEVLGLLIGGIGIAAGLMVILDGVWQGIKVFLEDK